MVLFNNLYVEGNNDDEVYTFESEGHACMYPIAYFAPFDEDDIIVEENDNILLRSTVEKVIVKLKEYLLRLSGEEIDSKYDYNIKEFIGSMVEKLENLNKPECTVTMYYGLFGDVMTRDDIKNMIEENKNKPFNN